MGRITTRHKAVRFDLAGDARSRVETIVVEEPLELRIGSEQLTVTMRTPGNDMELVHGFLLAEGIIHRREDVLVARYCSDTETMNVVEVTLRESERAVPVSAQRSLIMHGGCGLCGKTTIDAVLAACPPADKAADAQVVSSWSPQTLARCADALRGGQAVFAKTGGVHAAGLFDAGAQMLAAREDIGRHNAVDKVVGWSVMSGMDSRDRAAKALVVTSRASFEIVQKAAMAGVGIVACVSAPSSLAVEAAENFGLTLVAFLREDRMTAFSHPERLGPRDAQLPDHRVVTN